MALINTDGLSLMVFASEDVVNAWRESVIDEERKKEQRLDVTRYSKGDHLNNHTDSHSDTPHIDAYYTTGYAEIPARNTYSKSGYTQYTQTSHTNRYTKDGYSRYSQSSHTNRYSQSGYSRHTDAAARDSYSKRGYRRTEYANRGGRSYTNRRGVHTRYNNGSYYCRDNHTNSYSQSRYRRSHSDNHTNSYSQAARRDSHSDSHRNRYSEAAARNRHDNTHTNAYSQVAHTNSYSQSYSKRAHANEYSQSYSQRAAMDTGFDHENYIPSAPETYNIEGQIISDTLEVRLASYDKNNDGYGSQDQDSKDIYYKVELRQIQDMEGKSKVTDWETLQNGSLTDGFDKSLMGYEDGMYELRSTAYNLPRTEKGVTKTYVSDSKTATFMIVAGSAGQELTILNAAEFQDYIYGKDTYATTSDVIKKYTDSIIYSKSDKQKGLFLEIELKDEDTSTYHKTKANLFVGDKIITEKYNVVYETNPDGSAKPGDKIGLVFIPLEDMLDDGAFADVKINLETDEYRDNEFTKQIGSTSREIGLNKARDVVCIDVDGLAPSASISDASEKKVLEENISIAYSDTGLGLRDKNYQIVGPDEKADDATWYATNEILKTLSLKDPGKYSIRAKAVDKAGNEHITAWKSFEVSYADIALNVPEEVINQGSTFASLGQSKSDLEVKKTEFWVEKYTNEKEGTLTNEKTLKLGTEKNYQAYIETPENIPVGTHVVHFRVTYEDDIVKETSRIIEVDVVNAVITPIESDKDGNDITPFLIKDEHYEDTLVIQKGDKFSPQYYQKTISSKGIDISDDTTFVSHVPTINGKAETAGKFDVIYTSEKGVKKTTFTLHVIVNDPPKILAEDMYVYDRDIGKEKILEKITVKDKEDGTIKIDTENINVTKSDDKEYDVNITAEDSLKGKSKKTVKLIVIGEANAKEGPRFINKGSLAVLDESSIWTKGEYNDAINESLNKTTPKYTRKNVGD